LLDVQASEITGEMLVAAAEEIADVVSPDRLNASSIAPSVFDENVSHAVSRAVVAASRTRVRPGGGAKESAMQ
jgi:malate dehydrogenase (oxaloacetate-decarboxylating)